MKKGLIKAGALLVIFLASLALFGKLMNKAQVDRTTEIKAATLPVIVMYDGVQPLNELHGYSLQMQTTAMWDPILPVSGKKEIPFAVKTYGYAVDQIHYEIRNIGGDRLISDGDLDGLEEKDEQIRASIPVQKLVEPQQEYHLILQLKHKDTVVYYYTRIKEEPDSYVEECLQFALKLNEAMFRKETAKLGSYWEPDETGDNSTLNKVNIHSSVSQAEWAKLACSKLGTPIPSVKEMNSSYNIIMLQYVVTTKGGNGELEYYNVEEFYRIRYTKDRMYLLSFERTMNQIFNGENDPLYENYLQLGIRSTDVDYLQNEAGTVTAFVQEGDLWSYNKTTNRMAEVFRFRGREGMDARENWNQHGIRLMAIDESGSLDYVVYGYMNRGEHEGQSGISIMHYDSSTNTNEELLFVAYHKPFDILQAELGGLLYKNATNGLYLMLDGCLYKIDLETLETKEMVTDLGDDNFASSESNRYAAWVSEGSADKAEEITIMDMEKERTRTLKAQGGISMRVLGFLQENFVYGLASSKDEKTSASGIVQAPMYAVRIAEPGTLTQLKEYKKAGYYIAGIKIKNGVMVLNRMTASGDGYQAAQSDSVVSRSTDLEDTGIVRITVTEKKQTQVQLDLQTKRPEKAPVYITAKLVLNEKPRQVDLVPENQNQTYITYAKGVAVLKTTDISDAINSADENMGVVVNEQLKYVWKHDRKSIQAILPVKPSEEDAAGTSVAKCMSALMNYAGAETNVGAWLAKGDSLEELWETQVEDKELLEFNGCSVQQMLYYVNCGIPVVAIRADGQAVVMVGYDMLNVAVYEPAAGRTVYHSLEDMQKDYDGTGGKFITCLP